MVEITIDWRHCDTPTPLRPSSNHLVAPAVCVLRIVHVYHSSKTCKLRFKFKFNSGSSERLFQSRNRLILTLMEEAVASAAMSLATLLQISRRKSLNHVTQPMQTHVRFHLSEEL